MSPLLAVLTPCIGVCTLDRAGYCIGCHRHADEIASWLALTDAQREHLMQHVLPEREARRA